MSSLPTAGSREETIRLCFAKRDEDVTAKLRWTISEESLLQHETIWRPFILKHMTAWCRKRALTTHWPVSIGWDWRRLVGFYLKQQKAEVYSIVCRGLTQGMILLLRDYVSKAATGNVVYVSYLESAPWNVKSIAGSKRFTGTGTILLIAAAKRSEELGCGGRIGLHAEEPAIPFYEALGLKPFDADIHAEGLVYMEGVPNVL